MRLGSWASALAAAVVLAACSGGTPAEQPIVPPPADDGGVPFSVDAGHDAGTVDAGVIPDAGPADAGTPDAGTADAGTQDGGDAGTPADGGTIDAGTPADGGTTDGGTADGGTADGGTTDGGTADAGSPSQPYGFLGAGPWPTAPMTTYGYAQGLLEQPISASTDEQQNIWVVTTAALYQLKPGQARFHRYTAADGLHVGPGYTEPPDFTLVTGGGVGKGHGECFVGYWFHDTHDTRGQDPPVAHTSNDPYAHMGKMDQVLVNADGTLEVRRYDMRNTNNGTFYETRTVTQAIYDHFAHPGVLYVGSNHGIVRVQPSRWRLPKSDAEDPHAVETEWYADHVHPVACEGGSCLPWGQRVVTFGDWYGMALTDKGDLWMGGLTSAGLLPWTESLTTWWYTYGSYNPFTFAMGFTYPEGDPPVFLPPNGGDPVNIRAIAITPDKLVWFASGEVENWRGPTYGLAAFDGRNYTYVDPTRIGASEYNVLEMVALPDGRLVLGFPNSGLLVWKPGDPQGHRLTNANGLPGERIGRMYLDRMVDPPALYVPTEGGLAVLRAVP